MKDRQHRHCSLGAGPEKALGDDEWTAGHPLARLVLDDVRTSADDDSPGAKLLECEPVGSAGVQKGRTDSADECTLAQREEGGSDPVGG